MNRRFQRTTARVSHGLVSPSRSSLLRCCPPAPWRRSVRVPVFARSAEAGWGPWEGPPYRSPGAMGFGPFPAASCEGVPQHPFLGCSRRPVRRLLSFLVSSRRPRSLSGSESREPHFRRSRLPLLDGVPSALSRRPPWGFLRQRPEMPTSGISARNSNRRAFARGSIPRPMRCLVGRARLSYGLYRNIR
jgi:hypothetical protein